MANNVERSLEETIPILRLAERHRIFTSHEIRTFVADRRHHEYTVMRTTAERKHFLRFIAFEKRFSRQLASRVSTKKKVPQGVKDRLTLDARLRVNLIFSRAVKRFRGDADLWLHYVRHLLKDGSHRAASRVLARALAFCSSNIDVWKAAISFHFDKTGDATGARAIAQRALRALPGCPEIWIEYFRLELFFLARLVESRVKAGYSPEPTAEEGAQLKERRETKEKSRRDRVEAWRAEKNSGRKDHDPSNKRNKNVNSNKKRQRRVAEGGNSMVGENGHSETPNPSDGKDGANRPEGDEERSEQEHEELDGTEDLPEADGEDNEDVAEDDVRDVDVEIPAFWYGAVPLAVLRKACEKVSFSAKHRAQLFIIAVECPWVCEKFLLKVSTFLREKFPSCHVTEFIVVRLKWEMARISLDRVKAVVKQQLKSMCTAAKEKPSLTDLDPELRKSLVRGQKAAQKESVATLKLVRTYGEIVFKTIQEKEELDAVVLSFESFRGLFKRFGLAPELLESWKKIMSSFALSPGRMDVDVDPRGGAGLSKEQDSKQSIIKGLALFLKKGGLSSEIAVGEVTAQNFAELFRKHCVVPFRNEQQEQAVMLYLATEADTDRLHAVARRIMSVPPMRMPTIRAVIDAELRAGQDDTGGAMLRSPASIAEIRRLFDKGCSLPEAKRDVEFWLSFIQFEQKVARSAQMTSLAHAKALRVIDAELQEIFVERQLFCNLSSAL